MFFNKKFKRFENKITDKLNKVKTILFDLNSYYNALRNEERGIYYDFNIAREISRDFINVSKKHENYQNLNQKIYDLKVKINKIEKQKKKYRNILVELNKFY